MPAQCVGAPEAFPSHRDKEFIKLHWQLHGAYVVLVSIFPSQVGTFLVDYMKSISQSRATAQTARSNSQLIISLEAGKPQEGKKKVSQEKLSLWKNSECTKPE